MSQSPLNIFLLPQKKKKEKRKKRRHFGMERIGHPWAEDRCTHALHIYIYILILPFLFFLFRKSKSFLIKWICIQIYTNLTKKFNIGFFF